MKYLSIFLILFFITTIEAQEIPRKSVYAKFVYGHGLTNNNVNVDNIEVLLSPTVTLGLGSKYEISSKIFIDPGVEFYFGSNRYKNSFLEPTGSQITRQRLNNIQVYTNIGYRYKRAMISAGLGYYYNISASTKSTRQSDSSVIYEDSIYAISDFSRELKKSAFISRIELSYQVHSDFDLLMHYNTYYLEGISPLNDHGLRYRTLTDIGVGTKWYF